MNYYELASDEFITKLQEFSNNRIKNSEDLVRIFDTINKYNLQNQFEDLLFSAKSIVGMLRIIRNKDNSFSDEYFNKIKTELQLSTETVINNLKAISTKTSNFIDQIFNEKYYVLTQENIFNLYSLCEDLNFVKMYLNDLRREKHN